MEEFEIIGKGLTEEEKENLKDMIDKEIRRTKYQKPQVMYLCNGEKTDCRKNDCHINGGRCRHTKDVRYAKNFEQKLPDIPRSKYWEKEDAMRNETPSKN